MTAADYLPVHILESATLWAALFPLTPDAVRIRTAPLPMRLAWGGRVSAMTLGSTVFVDRVFLAHSTQEGLSRLIAHELMHARQWRRLGVVGFLASYLGDYLWARLRGLSHGMAYRQIRLEVEAEQFADSLM